MIEITEHGINDLINHEYDEHITMSMPSIFVKNVVFGGVYVDLGGQVQAINHKLGERVVIDFYTIYSYCLQTLGLILNSKSSKT